MRTVKIKDDSEWKDILEISHRIGTDCCRLEARMQDEKDYRQLKAFPLLFTTSQCRRAAAALIKAADEMEKEE